MSRSMMSFSVALLALSMGVARAEELNEAEQRLLKDVSVLASDELEGEKLLLEPDEQHEIVMH